jgi:methylisocitrate lyase
MKIMKERKTLRAMLNRKEVILTPAVFSPLTALIAQSIGFKAVHVAGSATGLQFGSSEPLITMTEMVAHAGSIVKAIKIPVVVDAGSGFGDPINVVKCVKEFEFAGVSAIHIDDQVYPNRVHYLKGITHVCPLEEFLKKLRAALKARTDPDFIIIARTDARKAVGGTLEEAIKRCQAFVEVGADAILTTIRDPKELEILRRQVPNIPFAGNFNIRSAKLIKETGTAFVMPGSAPIFVACRAIIDHYQNFMDTGEVTSTPELQEMRNKLEGLTSLSEYLEIEETSTEKDSSY